MHKHTFAAAFFCGMCLAIGGLTFYAAATRSSLDETEAQIAATVDASLSKRLSQIEIDKLEAKRAQMQVATKLADARRHK